MKRCIVLICLVLALMISLPANAEWELPMIEEDFSIRNGVSFGMSKDEVLAVEKSNGYTTKSDPEANYAVFSNVSFLGTNSTRVSHYFTKNNTLSSLAYSNMYGLTFATIKEALVDKYGEPMLTTELSPFTTALWKDNGFFFFSWGTGNEWSADTLTGGAAVSSRDGSIKLTKYAVWLVKYNDCAVVIELADANNGEYLGLGYSGISHENMEAWLEYIQTENEETANSYANDI